MWEGPVSQTLRGSGKVLKFGSGNKSRIPSSSRGVGRTRSVNNRACFRKCSFLFVGKLLFLRTRICIMSISWTSFLGVIQSWGQTKEFISRWLDFKEHIPVLWKTPKHQRWLCKLGFRRLCSGCLCHGGCWQGKGFHWTWARIHKFVGNYLSEQREQKQGSKKNDRRVASGTPPNRFAVFVNFSTRAWWGSHVKLSIFSSHAYFSSPLQLPAFSSVCCSVVIGNTGRCRMPQDSPKTRGYWPLGGHGADAWLRCTRAHIILPEILMLIFDARFTCGEWREGQRPHNSVQLAVRHG